MKIKVIKLILMFTILFALAMTACNRIPEYTYSQAELEYNKDDESDIDTYYATKLITDYAIYSFDTEISDEEKNKCVYYTEKILKK